MLKSKYKIYLLLLCLTGCVSEYNAQLPSSDEELLVVTGDIIANTEAIFSLSKSTRSVSVNCRMMYPTE